MEKPKSNKIEELEKRILALENAIRTIPITVQTQIHPNIMQSSYQTTYWCKWCGGYVNYCPGHAIC